MRKFKKMLGLSFENVVLMDIVEYYDLSTDKVEYAFTTNKGYSINCELFIQKYVG